MCEASPKHPRSRVDVAGVASVGTREQGVIRNITYEKLSLIDVTCPILIEQFYCASSQHPGKCANSTRAVQISHVAFRDIRGTQTSSAVGQFLCADAAPCRDIVLEDIYVQPAHRRTGWDSCVTVSLLSLSFCAVLVARAVGVLTVPGRFPTRNPPGVA
jgi:hypothetical protein